MELKEIFSAKSLHIFGWAFQVSRENVNLEKCIGGFRKSLEDSGWIPKSFRMVDEKGEVNRDAFMLKQYLSESAERIFFETKAQNAICKIYEYPMKEDNYYYHIRKEKSVYELPIESIELHVYNCGVGILFFKTLNLIYGDLADIKQINDYGRRINMAYIPKDEKDWRIWADVIGIVIKNKEGKVKASSVINYKKIVRNILEEIDVETNIKRAENTAEFLYDVLYGKLGSGRAKSEVEKNYSIESYSDDRMFLISMIRDNKLSEEIKGLAEEYDFKKKEYLEEKIVYEKLEEKIYAIIFADPGEASCQDGDMRNELLRKALYRRWLDYGSLYGITSYSYVAITSKNAEVNESVVYPFYAEYLYLISLVLAQRIGIARFSNETAKNAESMNRGFWKRLGKTGKHINLQRKFVVFENQMLVLEPSCQEQAIDIYGRLQEQLLVKEEEAVLEKQLQSLYEAITIWRGKVWSLVGTIVSVFLVIWGFFDKVFEVLNGKGIVDWLAAIVADWLR